MRRWWRRGLLATSVALAATAWAGPADAAVATADLELTVTGPRSVPVNTTVAYTVVVRNRGPDRAPSATFSIINTQTWKRVVGVAASQGTCTTAGIAPSCELGPLASGATATVAAVYEADEFVREDGNLTFQVGLFSTEVTDPNTTNNSVSYAVAFVAARRPQRGTTILVGRSTGTVLVRERGTRRFVRVTADTAVRPGSEIDTRNGTVELTSASDAAGTPQTALFGGGLFIVNQTRTSAVTELALSGDELKRCARLPRVKPASARRPRRRLFGAGKGRFRTKGYYGAATVRGTKWQVEDLCDRTRITVTQGVVDARDFVRRRTVRVRAGRSYTARATARR